jgi:hypothetical protein
LTVMLFLNQKERYKNESLCQHSEFISRLKRA